MIRPPHPGETIKEDYLVPLGMSVNEVAKALGIGAARLNEIVRGERPRWVGWVALLLAGAPILLAGIRTVPHAVRLGARADRSRCNKSLRDRSIATTSFA